MVWKKVSARSSKIEGEKRDCCVFILGLRSESLGEGVLKVLVFGSVVL